MAVYALIAALCFGVGWKVQGWRKDSQIADMVSEAQSARDMAIANARALEAAQNARAEVAAALEVERNKEARIVERVITNDVIKYVQRTGSQSCGVDADGVRIINASAASRMPENTDTAAAPDARAAAATAAAVVHSVTDNYATCHANANQLRALQDWVGTMTGRKWEAAAALRSKIHE
jgi:hypothetical protein